MSLRFVKMPKKCKGSLRHVQCFFVTLRQTPMHMQTLLLVFLLWARHIGPPEDKIPTTDKITISGDIKSPLTVTIADFLSYPVVPLHDVVIANHRGIPKDTFRNVKGVLLKNILSKVQLNAEKPKEMGEFYLTFVCSDSYKAVLSWDEIMSGETGKYLYVVTEKDNQTIHEMDSRILVVLLSDSGIGRKHMKCLEKIIVRRTQ